MIKNLSDIFSDGFFAMPNSRSLKMDGFYKYFLVRHGQDDETVRVGWCNVGLIEQGMNQTKVLGEQLEHILFHKIYSSNLERAAETTKIIYECLAYTPKITYSLKLRERNNGELAGMKNETTKNLRQ